MNNVMKELNKLSKNKENILALFFVLYILLDIPMPAIVTDFVSKSYGNIFVILLIVFMFIFFNPIVAVLGLVAAYELIKRSSISTGNYLNNYLPSTEKKKFKQFESFNNTPKTLEEEIIHKMAPMTKSSGNNIQNYKPVLDTSVDSSPVKA